jgi:hypothetical protein
VRGSCSVLAAPSYTPKHVDSLSPPAHGARNFDSVGSSYATVGAVGRLWTTPLRIQTTDSATCASALVPPTVYPRSALFGAQNHVHPFDTYFHTTCSERASIGTASGALDLLLAFDASIVRVWEPIHISSSLGHLFRTSPHTMHQPADADRDFPRSPKPANSLFTMESREGRIGNAFACERCRKHKVRCVPSDTTGICQRYVSRECGGPTRDDTCIDARKQESNASNMLRADGQQNRGASLHHQVDCATMIRSSTNCLALSQP